MNIYNNKLLSDEALVRKVRMAAKIYKQYAEKDVLIVYAKSKRGPFATYEFHAGSENFQHLAGIKSPKGAEVYSIALIMLKSTTEKKYSKIFYEVTKNIIEKADFDTEILEKIDQKMFSA